MHRLIDHMKTNFALPNFQKRLWITFKRDYFNQQKEVQINADEIMECNTKIQNHQITRKEGTRLLTKHCRPLTRSSKCTMKVRDMHNVQGIYLTFFNY